MFSSYGLVLSSDRHRTGLGEAAYLKAVWREKKREDRLRRQCDGVIRIVWEETRNPRQLDLLLRESGLRPSPRPLPPRGGRS